MALVTFYPTAKPKLAFVALRLWNGTGQDRPWYIPHPLNIIFYALHIIFGWSSHNVALAVHDL